MASINVERVVNISDLCFWLAFTFESMFVPFYKAACLGWHPCPSSLPSFLLLSLFLNFHLWDFNHTQSSENNIMNPYVPRDSTINTLLIHDQTIPTPLSISSCYQTVNYFETNSRHCVFLSVRISVCMSNKGPFLGINHVITP